MRSVELFGGAGGLALGSELAGLEGTLFVEWDRWACDTVRQNQERGFPLVSDWTVSEGDVRCIDWREVSRQDVIDVVAGGPPCQPFSMGGKARAADDSRDMFPAAAEVIRELRPQAFVLENVRGLTRAAFANYYQLILLRLKHPDLPQNASESWFDHLQRLQRYETSDHRGDSGEYRVVPTLVNAADYGVPQHRHRVFVVGFRVDVDAEWSFPEPTHSLIACCTTNGSRESTGNATAYRRPHDQARLRVSLDDFAGSSRLILRLWASLGARCVMVWSVYPSRL